MKNTLPHPKNVSAKIIRSVTDPIRDFMHLETSSSILLLIVTAVTLWWANSASSQFYFDLLHLEIGFQFGPNHLVKGLQHWVNDGLMVIFFFVVGLEIKREMTLGEISSFRKAALPVFAALGGVAVPALIYFYFNQSPETASGWAVPMATDIAFAVGILGLLGNRIPFALKIFLLALAIIDDLIAVIIIAIFYTADLNLESLFYSIGILGFVALMNYSGIRSRLVYVIFGALVWFAVLKSGVHATIAGVALGLLCPIRPLIPREELKASVSDIINSCDDNNSSEKIEEMRLILREAQSPLDQLVRTLHLWVAFLIMPLFALFNAGVKFSVSEIPALFSHPIGLGVVLGLAIGKPVGIFLMTLLSTKLKIAELPTGVTWLHIAGVGSLAGIGFTMALFIGSLSFSDPNLLDTTKLSILVGSTISAVIGMGVLLVASKPR
jgi:Na+:H+ antiporter, NhaA family